VYSTQELALESVTEAIERLDAIRRSSGARDLEAQVAAVWAMVGELDPELAKVAARY
jgi:capsule polysaccharide export protein KpsE/RkpR